MNCNCIKDLESLLTEAVPNCSGSSPVNMGILFNIKSAKSRCALMIPFRVTYSGKKRPCVKNIEAAFCPFCGKPSSEEASK